MKKLKLDKINLSEMELDSMKSVYGGANQQTASITVTTVTVPITIVSAVASCIDCVATLQTCITCKPGNQDSCGLCTTENRCPVEQR